MNSLTVQLALENFQTWLTSFWLVIPRMTSFFMISAFLSRGSVTGLTRGALILGLSMYAVPLVKDSAADFSVYLSSGVIILFVKELFLGLLLGYLVSIGFWAIETAGFFIDNQRGASIATVINPFSNLETSPLGLFFMQIAITYFFMTGLFLTLFEVFLISYQVWSPADFYPVLALRDIGFWLTTLDDVMSTALLLSSPIILTMFLGELGLAFANRFAPQLQVFFLALTIKTGIAFLVLLPYFYVLINQFYTSLGGVKTPIYQLFSMLNGS